LDQWRKGQQVRSRWARGACSGCTMVRRSRQSAGQWQRGRRMCHLLAHTEAVSPLAANHPTLLRPHLPNSHSHMQYEHISIMITWSANVSLFCQFIQRQLLDLRQTIHHHRGLIFLATTATCNMNTHHRRHHLVGKCVVCPLIQRQLFHLQQTTQCC